MTLAAADAELDRWRSRLAAASRNVSELSELPEFGAARVAALGNGRLADEARGLVATMDELWQGVLLIGGALDRAERVRRGARPWRSDEAAQQALAILQGPSITVELTDTPVLHRRLLAGPRDAVTVTPDTLLQTMNAAFDRAREQLARIAAAATLAGAMRARLAAAVASLPAAGALAARLDAAGAADPLDHLDALEALAPAVDAATAAFELARVRLAAATQALAAVQAAAERATAVVETCRAAVAVTLPPVDRAAVRELAAWLDRIGRTLEAGRAQAGAVGLANWQAQHDRIAAEVRAAADAAASALARRDELRARLGALRAKHLAQSAPTPAMGVLEATARATLARTPFDADAAARDLAAYEAGLAGRLPPPAFPG